MNTLPTHYVGTLSQYRAVHLWVERQLGKPLICSRCTKSGGTTKSYNWCNVSDKYLRDLKDWVRLCKSCHSIYDLDKYGKRVNCKNDHQRSTYWSYKKDGRGYCKGCACIYKKRGSDSLCYRDSLNRLTGVMTAIRILSL